MKKNFDPIPRKNKEKALSLSVIIPTTGRSKYLQSTIQSVFAQKQFPTEIIFVWNGCPEPDWICTVEEHANQYGIRIGHISHPKTIDISMSWASGAEASCSDLIFFLGDDDLIDDDFLKLAKEYFFENKNLDVFSANNRYIKESGESMNYLYRNIKCPSQSAGPIHVTSHSEWFLSPPPVMSSVFCRKSLAAINFFPYPGLAFDVWMFRELSMGKGYRLLYCDTPKVSYRRSSYSESCNGLKHALDYIQGYNQFTGKHGLLVKSACMKHSGMEVSVTALLRQARHPLKVMGFLASAFSENFLFGILLTASSRLGRKAGQVFAKSWHLVK